MSRGVVAYLSCKEDFTDIETAKEHSNSLNDDGSLDLFEEAYIN